MMSSIITPVEELAEEPPVASEDDSLMSLGLGLGIKVPMHLTKKGQLRLQSAVAVGHYKEER